MSNCAHVCERTARGGSVVCTCVSSCVCVCVHMHIMALHNESAQAPGDLTRIIRFFILSQQGHAKRV